MLKRKLSSSSEASKEALSRLQPSVDKGSSDEGRKALNKTASVKPRNDSELSTFQRLLWSTTEASHQLYEVEERVDSIQQLNEEIPCSKRVVTPERPQNRSVQFSESKLRESQPAAHHHWKQVKEAVRSIQQADKETRPWQPKSIFMVTLGNLEDFEKQLSEDERFSWEKLEAWRARGLHMVYLSLTTTIRMCHIVIRKVYYSRILRKYFEVPASSRDESEEQDEIVENHMPNTKPKRSRGPRQTFWEEMGHALFYNFVLLYEQVRAVPDIWEDDKKKGIPPIYTFCLYQCCSLSVELWRHPKLNIIAASDGPCWGAGANRMVQVSFEILEYFSLGRHSPYVEQNARDEVLRRRRTIAGTDYLRGAAQGVVMKPEVLWRELMRVLPPHRRARWGLVDARMDADEEELAHKLFAVEMEVEAEGEFDRCVFGYQNWSLSLNM